MHTEQQTLQLNLDGQHVAVATKPGFPGWDGLDPAHELLAEACTRIPHAARVVIYGAGHGALALVLARRFAGAQLVLRDLNAVALRMAETNLRQQRVAHATVSWASRVDDDLIGWADLVVIALPQSRPLVRRWLVEAAQLLRVGGVLLLGGANDLGIQPAMADAAALFGQAGQLLNRKRCRVARAVRPETCLSPVWAAEPGIAAGTWQQVDLPYGDRLVSLASLPGVFAHDHLDDGTALLLQHMPNPAGLRVLDIGCGYGPIGICAALAGAAAVDLVDVNLHAVAAASQSIRQLGLANTRALAGDLLEHVADQQYDLILSNPPFHTGKQINYEVAELFIQHGQPLLRPKGRMVVVANSFIRYERQIARFFPQTTTLANDGRYHVLMGS
ncbi:MAG: hypothetical protein Fur005_36930 [Roseiflexaceae bacterium]